MGRRLLERLRGENGFGLVELLVAMLILNIGLLAVLAAFVGSSTAVSRASRISTASTLADTQLELYRSLKWDAIALESVSIPSTGTYTTDSAYSASQVTATCASGTYTSYPQCNASRSATGPDRINYRVDTYIVLRTPTNGRQLKLVTVVVRDATKLSGSLARASTSFDQSTG